MRIKIALLALLLTMAGPSAAIEMRDFGWGLDRTVGHRPLLVIWIRERDQTPADRLAGYKQYLQDIVFGKAASASSAPAQPPSGDVSVMGYFHEVSQGRFGWTRVGVVGPLTGNVKLPFAREIARVAIQTAAAEGRFDFRPHDRNGDRTISADELTILVIANSKPNEGLAGTFGHAPLEIPGQAVTFAGNYAIVGEGGSFGTISHELFHKISPRARDIYGDSSKCFALNSKTSLMAATIVSQRDWKETFHLDPWHKMVAGWIEPRIHRMDAAGAAQLGAQHVPVGNQPERKRPILLYDSRKASSEFFLLEYRTPGQFGYDRNVGTSGLVIWNVLIDNAKNVFLTVSDRVNCKDEILPIWTLFVRGAPDWQLGVPRAYTASHGEVPLKWFNGDDTGVRVKVAGKHDPADPTIDVAWTVPKSPAPLTAISVTQATYGGNCGAPAGNVTRQVATACGGRAICTYKVDYKKIGDPKPGCRKDFKVTWNCGVGVRSAGAPGEAGYGSEIYMFC